MYKPLLRIILISIILLFSRRKAALIVCVCKQVSESELAQAMSEGHRSLDALSQCLGVGTGCGSCVDYAEELLQDSGTRAGPPVNALSSPA